MVNFQEQLDSFDGNTFGSLRAPQLDVLTQYDAMYQTSSDIGIELPTGAGKTLVALLIADYGLERGLRVAYLTGTRQLTNQVLAQSEGLPGLDVRQFSGGNYPAADLLAYNQAAAVGVMNYWVYFNASPKVQPADVLIFDDAHLAEQSLAGMYTLRISRDGTDSTKLYQAICDALVQSSPGVYPLLPALRDGAVPRATAPELISFYDWARTTDVVSKLIDSSPMMKSDRSASFSWRAIKQNLARCGVLIGPNAIEIRPYHIPTQTIAAYAKSRERVYLSATLGQTGDIQRRLGTRPVNTIVPSGETTTNSPKLGRRSFLINPSSDAALDGSSWAFAIEQVENAGKHGGGRVSWLCASTAEATEIERRLTDKGYRVFRLQAGDDSAVEQWQKVPLAHLVTAGRFDGLDFPDDVCRLVIIPSVPAASTEFERFVVAYLGDATYMRYRVGQRVTQALGRANRTPADAGLYIGLDPAFGSALADPAVHSALGSDVRAAVSEGITLHGGAWKAVRNAASDFWEALDNPPAVIVPEVTASRRLRPGRQVGAPAAIESAPNEVMSATRLWLGDSLGAAKSAQRAANILNEAGELEHAAFWNYVEAHSLFDRGSTMNASHAVAALKTAIVAAPHTAWFVRLQRTIQAMEGTAPGDSSQDALYLAWDEWIREAGAHVLTTLPGARQKLAGESDEQIEALMLLGRLCGVSNRRNSPPRAAGCRWAWANESSGHVRLWMSHQGADSVAREDVNELLALVLEEENLNPRSIVTGCLITRAGALTGAASLAASNTRIAIFDLDAVLALFDLLAERFTEYVSVSGAGTATERGAARSALETRLPSGNWLGALTAGSTAEIVSVQDVRNRFDGLA